MKFLLYKKYLFQKVTYEYRIERNKLRAKWRYLGKGVWAEGTATAKAPS